MRKIDEYKNDISAGTLDERLADIYFSDDEVSYEKDRYIKALDSFREIFGDNPVELYSAPGRSEICGNHTDHQHGEVLAASISDDAIAVAGKAEGSVRVLSEGYDMIEVSLSDLSKKDDEEGTTAALIRGVLYSMSERGHKIGGFDAFITSNVLGGSGLSSSAAFETIIGSIISGLYNDMTIDPIEIAIIGQYAENVYFGKPCGLMDQMACSVGSLCHIDFADPENPVVERLLFDLASHGYSLCITDTKGSHADLTLDYAAIPLEMKDICSYFGKEYLNELTLQDILSNIKELRSATSDRSVLRAIHFFEECSRVREICEAIKQNDMEGFLDVIKASGDSSFKYLQNVYPNHDIRNQNVSVALCVSDVALKDNGVARVHGGGFAGTIQAFVRNSAVADYRAAMDNVFGEGSCKVLNIRKYGGIRVF